MMTVIHSMSGMVRKLPDLGPVPASVQPVPLHVIASPLSQSLINC